MAPERRFAPVGLDSSHTVLGGLRIGEHSSRVAARAAVSRRSPRSLSPPPFRQRRLSHLRLRPSRHARPLPGVRHSASRVVFAERFNGAGGMICRVKTRESSLRPLFSAVLLQRVWGTISILLGAVAMA